MERTYVQIDLDKLAQNLKKIRRMLRLGCKLMAVLKADAYGHGIEVCAAYMEPLVDAFAAATLEEALAIRQTGTEKPVLLLGFLHRNEVRTAAEAEITCNLCGQKYAAMINEALDGVGLSIQGHIEFDTGMSRTGIRIPPGQEYAAAREASSVFQLPNIRITGAFTHFSCAESKDSESWTFTDQQYEAFQKTCDELEKAGFPIKVRHTSSTGPFLIRPEYCADMVRIGMLSYGMSIHADYTKRLGLEPVLTWYGRIEDIRDIPAGAEIGYGRTCYLERASRIAVVSVGYADGFPCGLGNQGILLIAGKRSSICGKLCMDFMLADVTEIPEAQIGEFAVLLGGSGENVIHANWLTEHLSYATCGGITAGIGARVPRVYYCGGTYTGIVRTARQWETLPVGTKYKLRMDGGKRE